jgi:ABC-type dipeptide/oligopeptide/nickel transport system ATPase component
MPFQFSIQSQDGKTDFLMETGSTTIFVGANGSGKTRLATHIETMMKETAHRISAHRSLSLNPNVVKISEKAALGGLRTGHAVENTSINNRETSRWRSKAATFLLNDFDFVVQALFADQNNISLQTHQAARKGEVKVPAATKFEQLADVCHRLLPKRRLTVSGDDIQVGSAENAMNYSASDMSDGERATFYLIGQTLLADSNSLLIFDEPELHIHRSIMSKLWDELEALRPDCAFLLITHDLEFAAAREAQKYVTKDYFFPSTWNIELVPKETGFDEETTTLILGSRRPILFVEGCESSLDLAIYRNCYPDWTVIPKGPCTNVIHSVKSMRSNSQLTRITCAGIVDADDRSEAEIVQLNNFGIAILPVSEIENLVCLPSISKAIAECEGFDNDAIDRKLGELKAAIFARVENESDLNSAMLRHCKNKLDNALKSINVGNQNSVQSMNDVMQSLLAEIQLDVIAQEFRNEISAAIQSSDLQKFLQLYDNKSLFGLAASFIKPMSPSNFKSWLLRALGGTAAPKVREAFMAVLPKLTAK